MNEWTPALDQEAGRVIPAAAHTGRRAPPPRRIGPRNGRLDRLSRKLASDLNIALILYSYNN